jgi:hypothetical protein
MDAAMSISSPASKSKAKKKFSFRKVAMVDAVFLLAAYVLLSPVVGMPLYNKLVFFPFDQGEDVSVFIQQIQQQTGGKRTVLAINTPSGERLDGWYFKKEGAKKLVILSHGNGGNNKHRLLTSMILLKCDANVLVYDYRGFGKSTGSPTVPGIKEDGLAVYDYATRELGYKPQDIVVYGESLGCGVAAYIASHRQVGGVILQSGFSSLSSAAKSRLPWMWLYPQMAFNNIEMDNLSYVRGQHPPLLLVHGDQDAILPVSNSDTMFAQATQPTKYVKIKGAGHNDAVNFDVHLFATSVQSFIQSLQ